jgi:hypothetical protein
MPSSGKPGIQWRYELEELEEPVDASFAGEHALSAAWRLLQILHTPFRATEQEEFQRLVTMLRDLEKTFRGDPTLCDYYLETMAPGPLEVGGGSWTPHSPKAVPDFDCTVRQMAELQARFMEDVFFVLRLDRFANAPDNRGWMNLFRRWGRSPRFNAVFDQIHSTLTSDFVAFYDVHLFMYMNPIDTYPVPHPWTPIALRTHWESPRPPDRSMGQPLDVRARAPEPRVITGVYLDSGIREEGPISTHGEEENPSDVAYKTPPPSASDPKAGQQE